MKKIRQASRGISLLLGTLATLILGLAGFYYVSVTGNERSLDQRNLRELARIARTVEGRINNLANVLRNQAEERAKKLPTENGLEQMDCRTGLEKLNRFLEIQWAAKLEGQEELTTQQARVTTVAYQKLEVAYKESERCAGAASFDLRGMQDVLESDFFDLTVLTGPDGAVILSEPVGSALRLQQFWIREDEPKEARDGATDALSTGRSSSHVDSSSTEPRRASPTPPRLPESAVEKIRIAGRSYRQFLQPLRVQIPHVDEPAEGGRAAGAGWAVGGLVSAERFRAESLAFHPTRMLAVIVLLVAAALSLPFLRILLMGRRERLNVRQVMLLAFSFVLMAGLLGLLLADTVYYSNLKRIYETGVENVGLQLERDLVREIKDAIEELEFLERRFHKRLADSPWPPYPETSDPGCPWVVSGLFQTDTTSGGKTPTECQKVRDECADPGDLCTSDQGDTRYPYFQMVTWIDPKGRQVAKWTPRENATPLITVETRRYFQRNRRRQGWPIGPRPAPDEADEADEGAERRTFTLDSIRSLNTGEEFAVLAAEFCWESGPEYGQCPEDKLGVVAMDLLPFSLYPPVLPPGFEFIVIEPDGRTLFHSRLERNLGENFFDETDQNPLLRSAVIAGLDHPLDARYMGRDHRLFVSPIEDWPLFLVVTYDKGYLRTLNLETLFVGTAILGFYSLLVLLVFSLAELSLRRRLVWAWPDHHRPRRHRVVAALLAAFSVALLLQVLFPDHLPLHPSSFLWPLVAMGLALVVLDPKSAAADDEERAAAGGRRQWRWCWRDCDTVGWMLVILFTVALFVIHASVSFEPLLFLLQMVVLAAGVATVLRFSRRPMAAACRPPGHGYSLSLALIPILLGFLPSYLVVQDLFRSHHVLLAQHQQLEVGRRLEARVDELTKRWRDNGVPEGPWTSDIECKSGSTYLPFPLDAWFRNATCERGVPRMSGGDHVNLEEGKLHELLHGDIVDMLPFRSSAAVELRQLSEVEGFTRVPEALMLDRPSYRALSSLPSRLGLPVRPDWYFILAAALGLLYVMARWLADRVFLANLPPGKKLESRRLEAVQDLDPSGPCLLVVCTRATTRKWLERHEVRRVNLIDVAASRESLPAAVDSGSILCLDFFDHRFHEPKWNARLLDWLERTTYVKKCRVLLLTGRTMDDLLAGPTTCGEAGSLDEAICGRWRRLLGRFVTIRLTDESVQEPPRTETGSSWSRAGEVLLESEHRGVPVLAHATEKLRWQFEGESDPMVERAEYQLRDLSAGYYEAIWAILGREEQLVVAQLAAGSVVNPQSAPAVRCLEARGLVKRDPELGLMNRSFARFVRERAPKEELLAWEKEGALSAWQQLRAPLYLALAAVVLFLFVTQAELFSMATAFLSTIAILGGSLFRLTALVQRKPGGTGTDLDVRAAPG